KKIVFSVDSIYIFNSNPNYEVFKKHPNYNYLVIYDGFPTKGGGWYGQYNSIHHSWPVDYFGGPFASTATDGIIHEFGHARGAIDLYALEVPDSNNPINNQAYIAEESIMNYPYGVTVWDQHSINLINFNEDNKTVPINYITEAFPQNIEILVVDAGKKPISNVVVKLFPIEWYNKKIDENIFYQFTTNSDGLIKFEENPFQPNVSDYPWNIRFPNFLIFSENNGSTSFCWLPITKVQNRYFSGELSIYRDTLSFGSIVTSKEVSDEYCDFYLSQNYPNPFNPTTNIRYSIANRQFIILKIFNVLGQEIETLVNEEKSVGNYQVEFKAANLPSGIYFYTIQAGSFVE
ncbi:MAG: T9SS type A sorting domain-containing protein, partial [Ignavibacteriaceae bacterium]